ncbi:MAG TPA: hypothetical protein VNS12_02435 [Pelagibacterium sp.]|uniref:hypothetical protein n=1 Tax=Pelagibacterium sp. TaxID=1967288 RepID=UPI002C8857D5|nr:hypothetical protein [Pelagibacterium sp.]HWJ86910.1 hypothetical protein [Pelagibacterium sp.]
MKAVWSNPIIWGYKHGYSIDEIAAGLMVPRARVRGEIIAYDQRIIAGRALLRQIPNGVGDTSHIRRMSQWQRETGGARAAIDAIEAQRNSGGGRDGR